MSNLNYQLMSFANDWVLWVEGVPVERFASKTKGLSAAKLSMIAAHRRGDTTSLIVKPLGGVPIERYVQ